MICNLFERLKSSVPIRNFLAGDIFTLTENDYLVRSRCDFMKSFCDKDVGRSCVIVGLSYIFVGFIGFANVTRSWFFFKSLIDCCHTCGCRFTQSISASDFTGHTHFVSLFFAEPFWSFILESFFLSVHTVGRSDDNEIQVPDFPPVYPETDQVNLYSR